MAVRVQNPFEASFENLSSGTVMAAAKKVKKAGGQVASAVVGDAKQQITGKEPGQPVTNVGIAEQLGLKTVKHEDKQQVQQKQEQTLAQTRQNLDTINRQIQQVREERAKKLAQKQQVETQQKQEKKAIEEKKKADPIWKRMLKGNQGAHEGNKHVSG